MPSGKSDYYLPPPPNGNFILQYRFSHHTGFIRITKVRIWICFISTSHRLLCDKYIQKMKNQDTHNMILHNFY